MDINRNNYEEYFLLYADNELSESEKEVVKAFVRKNMDLKNEFLVTQLTIISADQDIKLNDKSFLLKKETNFITENNYEEIFVLYHDGELSDQQKKETELFAEQSLKFKKVFEWIGQSKLIPDRSVIYPLKNQLYKKERRAKIITLNRIKGIAAAIFIGFGIWLLVSYFNQDSATSRSVSLSKSIIEEAVKEKSIEKKNADMHFQSKKMDTTSDITQIENSKNSEKSFNKQEIKPDLIAVKRSKIKNQKNENQIVKISVIKTQPDIHLQLATPDETIEEIPTSMTKVKSEQVHLKLSSVGGDANRSGPPWAVSSPPTISEGMRHPIAIGSDGYRIGMRPSELQNITVAKQRYEMNSEVYDKPSTQIVYNNTSNESQDYVFYDISAEEFRRSKVGSFLKKIKRVVERNNPITRLFALSEEQIASKN